MSNTKPVRDFLAKVRADEALKERFQKLWEAGDLAGIQSMGGELGISFSKEDYEAAVQEDLERLQSDGRLSDEELQAVAGGAGGPGITVGSGCSMITVNGQICGPSAGTPMCSEVTCC
jgi:predicted ribosomally synthesized peptide with nif11-like leader